MTDREPGFYWVRYRGGNWEPAQKVKGNRYCWYLLMSENAYNAEELDEIGPKIESPKEGNNV